MLRRSKLLWAALLVACVAEDEPAPISEEFRVQYDRMYQMFAVSPAPSGATAEAELARGAIHVAALDNDGNPMIAADGVTPVRYTCGSILVAPSYIVTAAHCVDEKDIPDPKVNKVTLEMYPVEHDLDWMSGIDLTTPGDWFEFEHDEMTAADGYHTETFECELLQRCGQWWGDQIECNEPTSDVALLRCDGRPGDTYGFVPIASTDIDTAQVFMPWAHEVYDFDGFWGDDLLYDHYNTRNPIEESIHYFGGDRNQLLPLVSAGWDVGDLGSYNSKLYYDESLGVRWTDLIGCHGTSGSPVFQWNVTLGRYEYLGPVSRGTFYASSVPGGMPETNQLCQEPDLHAQWEANLAYSQLKYTKEVVANANDCSGLYDKGPILSILCIMKDLNLVWEEVLWPWDFWPCLTCPPPWVKIAQVYDPFILVSNEEKFSTPLQVEEGTSHRVSALVVSATGEAAKVSMVNAAGETLATVEATDMEKGVTVMQATIKAGKEESLTFVAEDGNAYVTRIAAAPVDVANGFERMVDRVGVGMMSSDDLEARAVAMRFAAQGKGDFAAILERGERMVLTREALPIGEKLALHFATEGKGQVRAGFVLADGSEITSMADVSEGVVKLDFDVPSSAPIAVLIEGTELATDLVVDDVLVGTP